MNDHTNTPPIHVIARSGQRPYDAAGEMGLRVRAVLNDYADKDIPLATVVGVLEIIKADLIEGRSV